MQLNTNNKSDVISHLKKIEGVIFERVSTKEKNLIEFLHTQK
jgi:hypothetical protein